MLSPIVEENKLYNTQKKYDYYLQISSRLRKFAAVFNFSLSEGKKCRSRSNPGAMQKENRCNNHYRTFCFTLSRRILWISLRPCYLLAVFFTGPTTMPLLSSHQLPTSVANSFLKAKYIHCANCSSVLLLHVCATIKWKRQEKQNYLSKDFMWPLKCWRNYTYFFRKLPHYWKVPQ